MCGVFDFDDLRAELVDALKGEADELTSATFELGGDLFPDWMREPPVLEHVFGLTRNAILRELEALRKGADLPVELPDADLAGARDLAQTATPVSSLLGSYRSSQQALWNRWESLVEERGLPAPQAAEIRRRGSDFFFAYAARMSAMAADEYAAERSRMLRSADRLLVNAVCAVLDGDDAAVQRLDHPVDGHNIAVVGSGEGMAERLADVATTLDSRLLVIDVLPDPWWAWLGRTRPFGEGAVQALRELEPPAGAILGLGTVGEGANGFRDSHREAVAALFATDRQRPVVDYREVAVEDLAARDAAAADDFVAKELGELNGEDARSERLRETLVTYFASGDNARATAAQLGVHQQTVGQRLDAIEKRIGAAVKDRRVELGLALRLRGYLAKRAVVEDRIHP